MSIEVSGQHNKYEFNLNSNLFSSILLCTNRVDASKNYAIFGIKHNLKTNDNLMLITRYVDEKLLHLGARLVTRIPLALSEKKFSLKEGKYVAVPVYIEVKDHTKVRKVIETIFANHEMSSGARADIEPALRELEKSARFASKRTNSISTAQKEALQSVILPYLEDIKAEVPDNETAKKCVEFAALNITTYGPVNAKEYLPNTLKNISVMGVKSEAFFESLIALAKIYASMGDMESTFERLGETIPSESIVKQVVFDLFV